MSNNTKNLPIVKAVDLHEAAKSDEAWDYLFHFTDKYFEMLEKSPDVWQQFNNFQLVLFTYNCLYGDVVNGGFIQLIINGRTIALEPSFAEALRVWGAGRIAEIIDKAKISYENNKDELLRGERLMVEFSEARSKITDENEAELLWQKTAEEHSKIYNKITDFEPLEDAFY